jgi:hypothetical protein
MRDVEAFRVSPPSIHFAPRLQLEANGDIRIS